MIKKTTLSQPKMGAAKIDSSTEKMRQAVKQN
jgi:hypothetical protein